METNTLYYTFSTIPQVLGAIAAIMGAFSHFRINTLKQYLVGDGQAILNRWGDPGYEFPDPNEDTKQKKRLEDAIARNNVKEIKHVIFLLRNIERDDGYTRKKRPKGLQYIYEDRFCGTEEHIQNLKAWTLHAITLSFLTIVISILSLSLTEILSVPNISLISLAVNVFLCLLSLAMCFWSIRLGFMEKTLHERERVFDETS